MGTQKRERQKANRQQRLIEEARAERAGKVKRTALRWVMAGVAAVVAVVLIAWAAGAFSGDDTDEAATDGTLAPVVTAPPVPTFETPEKPAVEIPAAIPEDLVITVLEPGSGREAVAGDTVWVHYVGVRSEDGTEFDNSYDRDAAFGVENVGSGAVIAGWNEGLIGAQPGSRIQLDIPSELAYGDADRGTIRPGDALTFVIDVMDVVPGS